MKQGSEFRSPGPDYLGPLSSRGVFVFKLLMPERMGAG